MLLLFTQPGCMQCLIGKRKLEEKRLNMMLKLAAQ